MGKLEFLVSQKAYSYSHSIGSLLNATPLGGFKDKLCDHFKLLL